MPKNVKNMKGTVYVLGDGKQIMLATELQIL